MTEIEVENMMDMEAPTWETCKENVVPIKRGRSAKGLTDTLDRKESSKAASAAAEHAQEEAYEARLAALASPSPSSSGSKAALEVYVQYFKWVRDTYPSDNAKALTLLERCTCALKDDAALRNDTRFVKMWVEYADLVRTPGEVFSFMQSRKIGESVALFWVAWAFVAEKVGSRVTWWVGGCLVPRCLDKENLSNNSLCVRLPVCCTGGQF